MSGSVDLRFIAGACVVRTGVLGGATARGVVARIGHHWAQLDLRGSLRACLGCVDGRQKLTTARLRPGHATTLDDDRADREERSAKPRRRGSTKHVPGGGLRNLRQVHFAASMFRNVAGPSPYPSPKYTPHTFRNFNPVREINARSSQTAWY